MRKLLLGICFVLSWSVSLHGQTGDGVLLESALQGMAKQLATYPQEKIHLHLDRSTYYPGDSIRFRAYMVHSTFHTPIHYSRYIYAELINPFDQIVSRAKIRDTDTTTMAGYLALADDLPAGNYLLRAYTAYMASDSIRHFYSRSVRIVAPAWEAFDLRVQPLAASSTASLSLQPWDRFTDSPVPVSTATATLANGALADIPIVQQRLQPAFKPNILEKNRTMLLELQNTAGERYRKYMPLATGRADFDLTFYPEGGYLLQGVRCRVGFKALDQMGYGKAISLSVLDDRDSVLTNASTLYDGLGSFSFTPQPGRSYRARCEDAYGILKEKQLPLPLPDGKGIQVETTDSTFVVQLQESVPSSLKSVYLLAHVRGAVLYFAPWPLERQRLIFDKRHFPSGVVQFLLLDGQWNPLAERLVFGQRKEEQGSAHIVLQKEVFEKRDLVEATLSLQNGRGEPLSGDFSFAVTDNGTGMTDTAHSILATLLLSSELRGHIERPAFYLREDSLSRATLDALLLVHGWRRYDLPAVLQGRIQSPKRKPEQFMQIAGRIKPVSVFDWGRDYAVRIRGLNNRYKHDVRTDNKRVFVFDSLEYADGAGFHISAVKKGEYFPDGDRYILLEQPEEVTIHNEVVQDPLHDYRETSDALTDTLPLVTRRGRDFLIKPVQVHAPYWGSTEYMRFRLQDVGRLPYHDMSGLLKHMGLRISTDFIYSKQVRVAVFVNGELMDFHSNVLYELKLSDLEEIVYLPFVSGTTLGRLAGMYMGKQGRLKSRFGLYGNEKEGIPALHIVTKETVDTRHFGSEYMPRFSDFAPRSTIYPLGYQQPVEVYQPAYDTPEKKADPAPDQRETIYWQPTLSLDAKGKAHVSFYTSDEAGTYSLIVEGISEKGEVLWEVMELKVK